MVNPNQYSLSLIPHTYGKELIQQRAQDGYINATEMCKASGKEFKHYNSNAGTKAFIEELSTEVGIPTSDLVQSISGGAVQGTWVHPQVAIHLGQWLSPKFAVQVSQWVFEWMSGLGSPASGSKGIPLFVQRFNTNWDKVESGHFSVISELFIRVYGRLEQAGHVLSDKSANGTELRPDVSVGLTFPKWLKKNHPGLADKFKFYKHTLPNKIVVDARQYHNSVLPAFIEFIEEEWLKKRAGSYFKERDPVALEYLPKLLSGPA